MEEQANSFFLSLSQKVLSEVVKHGPSLVTTSTSGFLKGFLLYFGPVTLLKRKLQVEALRRAIALGGFVSVVRIVDFILKEVREKKYNKLPKKIQDCAEKYPKAIAGAAGAIVAALIDQKLINSIFVLWVLIRGVRSLLPSSEYGQVALLCLSAAQIGVCWTRYPHLLDSSYKRFLDHQGGKPKIVLDTIAGNNLVAGDFCKLSHPGVSCIAHGAQYTKGAFLRSVKLYAPIFAVVLLFSKKKSLVNFLKNLLRSSVFLTTYCAIPWISNCITFKYPFASADSKVSTLVLYLRLWLSGLALIIERPSRRSELAGYCCTYAIDSLYKASVSNGIVQPNFYAGLALFALGASILIHHHKEQPSILSKWLLGFKEDAPLNSSSSNDHQHQSKPALVK